MEGVVCTVFCFTVDSFRHLLRGKIVKWFTDNQGITRIVGVGSMKPELQQLALKIYSVCLKERVRLEVEWLPREENVVADGWSRVIDWDDWSVKDWLFQKLNALWGPFSIDRFADDKNAKLTRFNSKFWVPRTEQVDAFSVPWTGENNWLVPPPKMIIRTLKHLSTSRAKGTIIIPQWKAHPFWPFLEALSRDTNIVQDVIIFDPKHQPFNRGTQSGSIFGPDFPSQILALRLDATAL